LLEVVSQDTAGSDKVHAAVIRCVDSGVTGTTELGGCVNSRLAETKTQPAGVTDAEIEEAAGLCATRYTETRDVAVCVEALLRHGTAGAPH
jgi:hypothetical protein